MSTPTSRSIEDDDYDFCWPGPKGSGAPYDDGYDLMRELTEKAPDATMEHPLDTAMRTNNQGMRCYYEEHGEKAVKLKWRGLGAAARASYNRLPIVTGSGLPSGSFFVRSYEGKVAEIPETSALDHPMFAFQAF